MSTRENIRLIARAPLFRIGEYFEKSELDFSRVCYTITLQKLNMLTTQTIFFVHWY